MSLPIIALAHFASSARLANAIVLNGTDERLSRTATATTVTRTKFTFDGWVYPTSSGVARPIYTVDTGANGGLIWLTTGNVVRYDETDGVAADTINALGTTTISANVWTHIHLEYDSTQATAANRVKIWINGSADTVSFPGSNTPDLNQSSLYGINTLVHSIGWDQNTAAFFPGRLALLHWIDGTVVSVSTFGQTVGGQWQAKLPTGLTYGNNGFFLDFSNASALGTDVDAGHNFTLTNIDATNATGNGPTIAS